LEQLPHFVRCLLISILFVESAITAIEAAVNSALEEMRKATTQMREDKEEQPPANYNCLNLKEAQHSISA